MEENASVVACVAWVRRGAAKEVPDRIKLDEENMRSLLQTAERDLRKAQRAEAGEVEGSGDEDDEWETDDEADEPWTEAQAKAAAASAGMEMDEAGAAAAAPLTDIEERYNLADYDDDEGGAVGVDSVAANAASGLAGLVYHMSNEDDPYLAAQQDEEDEDEIEDFRVRPEDNLLVVGQTEDVYSHLSVNVFDEVDTHLFVHHDVMLASYPLALEWLDFDPESEGEVSNLLAVGSMSPQIEVWDLDIVDGVEPAFTLGEPAGKGKKKDRQGHSKEVMALSWNPNQRNLLASGSADCTVKLWDLSTLSCLRTYTHHRNKVSSVEWNPVESAVLLTGSFDRTAKVFDTRDPDAVSTWKFATDVECLKWNIFEPHVFMASTEDGFVYACDTHKEGTTLFTLQAHDLAVSSLSFSHYVPGMMVTASIDKTVKVWDVHDGRPKFVSTQELDRKALYTVEFSPDSPGVVAVGGMEKGVTTLDVFDIAAVSRAFKDRAIKEQPRPVERRAAVPEDADDETIVYADGEDPDDENESWLDIVKDLHISPSEETVQEAEKPSSASKKKPTKKNGKKGGKKKKK